MGKGKIKRGKKSWRLTPDGVLVRRPKRPGEPRADEAMLDRVFRTREK